MIRGANKRKTGLVRKRVSRSSSLFLGTISGKIGNNTHWWAHPYKPKGTFDPDPYIEPYKVSNPNAKP